MRTKPRKTNTIKCFFTNLIVVATNISYRFIFDKNCTDYLEYRREVMERRRGDKYDPLDELQYEDYKKAPSMMLQGPKTFGFHYSQQT